MGRKRPRELVIVTPPEKFELSLNFELQIDRIVETPGAGSCEVQFTTSPLEVSKNMGLSIVGGVSREARRIAIKEVARRARMHETNLRARVLENGKVSVWTKGTLQFRVDMFAHN